MNRELSWLKFNERVLEEAENKEVPLCERMRFVSIYQTNLDEFFRVRVGSLQDEMLMNDSDTENKTHMTSGEQIEAILQQVKPLNDRKDAVYQEIMEEARHYGVQMVDFSEMTATEQTYLSRYFDREIAPLVSPTVVGKRQPFPFIHNGEIYAVVVLKNKNQKERLGIVPCTNTMLERMIELPGKKGRYVLLEDLILHFIDRIFNGYQIVTKSLIRAIRSADIDADALYDEDLDYREFMESLMQTRKRLSPVRLDLSRAMDGNIEMTLCRYLDIQTDRIYHSEAPLEFSFISQIRDLLRRNTDLFYHRRLPQKSPDIRDGVSMIQQIKEGDKLLSFPYEGIRPFIRLLEEAADDPTVMSIKMTLYRLAKQSQIVEALCEAAENGKEVVVLVELRARFDEENNIEWSRRLEEAGCQVIYGLQGYKVHSKLCLITRKTQDGIEYITQIGTGNYNEITSRQYTDLSLMTANEELGREASEIFQSLTKGEIMTDARYFMVSPHCLQSRVLDLIDEEIAYAKKGEEAYIGLKLNALTDKKIMDKLIEASCAGVRIEMVVRGICCLIPGVNGQTENIRIISVVGRFLEHSRLYIFGTGNRTTCYISSADFMTRNTEKRVEVAAPIYDEKIKQRLLDLFQLMLSDNQKARQEEPDGTYHLVRNDKENCNAQEVLYQMAYERAAEGIERKAES